MLTENTIFLARPLRLSLSLSRNAWSTARVTILLRTIPVFVCYLCVAPLYITHHSSTRVSPLALPNLGNRVETLGRAPSPLAINRYVTRCQLRTAVSVTVINPACLPRSCVIVPANRNSARVHIEQDNTSRNGAARRGASLCKYAEVEGIDRLLNSPLPEAWKFLQFFSGKKISWEEIFWEGNRDTRTSMHSFSRIFNIRRPLSTLLVAQSLYRCNHIESSNG